MTPTPTRIAADFPGSFQLLVRGITRRCPWCGDRKAYFTGWFKRQSACRSCGHGFRRGDDAFELGAITANIILTFGLMLMTILVLVVATSPDIAVWPITITAVCIGLLGPVLFYPASFTLWQAIDLVMRRPTAAERAGHDQT
ncbi:MAG TPA: DUF983 domain-containing protein [Ilumatobacter sp.]|nr:DUF983 domain-containing protein [Ilumatobacter sp.]